MKIRTKAISHRRPVFGGGVRQAVWLYYWFTLSLRHIEDLLAERGIDINYETIRDCGPYKLT